MSWRRARGWPLGQVADYRRRLPDGRCAHCRVWPDGTVTEHVDLVDPLDAPLWHLVFDTLPWIGRGAQDHGEIVDRPELAAAAGVGGGGGGGGSPPAEHDGSSSCCSACAARQP